LIEGCKSIKFVINLRDCLLILQPQGGSTLLALLDQR
jgi:hypothetical protein